MSGLDHCEVVCSLNCMHWGALFLRRCLKQGSRQTHADYMKSQVGEWRDDVEIEHDFRVPHLFNWRDALPIVAATNLGDLCYLLFCFRLPFMVE